MYTHRVVDDINFQVNNAFGWAGKIFIFQDVTLLLTIMDLIPNMKVCFYLSEMHSDKFLNAEMHTGMRMDQSPADVGWGNRKSPTHFYKTTFICCGQNVNNEANTHVFHENRFVFQLCFYSHVIRGWLFFQGSQHSCLCLHQKPSIPAPSECLLHYWHEREKQKSEGYQSVTNVVITWGGFEYLPHHCYERMKRTKWFWPLRIQQRFAASRLNTLHKPGTFFILLSGKFLPSHPHSYPFLLLFFVLYRELIPSVSY